MIGRPTTTTNPTTATVAGSEGILTVDDPADVERRDVKATMARTSATRTPRRRYRFGAAVAVAAVSVLTAAPAAWAATGGYGPGGPGSQPPPGGFSEVAVARTIGARATHLVVNVAGAVAVIDVAPKTFQGSVILKITSPNLDQITSSAATLSVPNTKAVAGIGVDVLLPNGKPAPTPFGKPMTVTLYGVHLGAGGERVVALSGPKSTAPIGAAVGLFYVRFSLTGDANVAVLNPTKASHGRSGAGSNGAGQGPKQAFAALSLSKTPSPSASTGTPAATTAGAPETGVTAGPAAVVAPAAAPASALNSQGARPTSATQPAGGSPAAGGGRSKAGSFATVSHAVADGPSTTGVPTGRNVSSLLTLGALGIVLGLAAIAVYALKASPRTARP